MRESNKGAINKAVMFVSFIKMLKDGPAPSFKGSPTVSPNTVAACVGLPSSRKALASMLFLVLSHNAPPKVKNDDNNAVVQVPPRSIPPKARGPSINPINKDEPKAFMRLSTLEK